MFISDQEGRDRIDSPDNVLSRVSRDSSLPPVDSQDIPEINLPDPLLIPDLQEKIGDFDPASFVRSNSFDPFVALKIDQILDPGTPGRALGIRNRTNPENGSVALSSMLLGGRETERIFGVQASTQVHLKEGKTGPNSEKKERKVKEDLLEEIYTQGQMVTRRAFNRLSSALNLITDEKLQAVDKALDLTRVAQGMSKIIHDLTPKDSGVQEQQVQFHIYRPDPKAISDYEMVVVGSGSTSQANNQGKLNDANSSGSA